MIEGLLPSAARLIGQGLKSVKLEAFTWFFIFGDDLSVATESAWRLITPSGIEVTSLDHGHPFGLPQPVDAAERVRGAVGGQTITSVECDAQTGDLTIRFGDFPIIQFLQTSCGYESWRLHIGQDEWICVGGGGVMNVSKMPLRPHGGSP